MTDLNHTRNFCIIAHVDHGKTTLSDRILELTRTVEMREMKDQLLDSMDLERERGITIKSHPVSMVYKAKDGKDYTFNLIDTPGHVDFSYEVSRSLAACEGAMLLIDAAQGIEAQTVANAHLAIEQGLEIIPVINKVDLPGADIPAMQQQLEDVLAIPADEAVLTSGKTGIGIEDLMEAAVARVPKPRWAEVNGLRVLIFDCVYDAYKGVICYVRVFSGSVKSGDNIITMSDGRKAQVKEVGKFSPEMTKQDNLVPGDVGYIVTNIRDVAEIKLGDTITLSNAPAEEMLPGYKEVSPMVFSGIYPIDTNDYNKLKASMGKLRLNDAAFVYSSENSVALGFGFRCGFLGLLHMEIIQERIRREYDLDVISTYPSVVYHVTKTDGEQIEVHNPVFLPDPAEIDFIEEPMIKASIHIPSSSIGDVLALMSEKRGICEHTETIDDSRVMLVCRVPLNEILVDFNDRLKSVTHGYGSMDYEMDGYERAKLCRLDILVNQEQVDAFSSIVHVDKAEGRGRALCSRLKEILPRQMFKIAIQAAIGGKVVARETISAYRKDVTAKCYGGDISRKRKLLEKQKEGKKRMKNIGSVSIPQDAFIKILKTSDGG
ncbi:translation elongation factor 4 [Coraliomargarita akajimensis]|uniref:Elongation factor 4 n=1 Tax=Coraliomargarita akajimensis (strain DSM 45221 / IAM 15411 / JCM 23193 / KCTC 12865 / 04OKA010-24) TaxID=583355 RepID=D5EPP9_CORAD|nr:translation elongation factor 4 [Coraliomargarita akajimensis]ADE53786.1 GTP-binding protein LepA [Coraliomargarita akajimensis DSM 45221]